MLNQLRSLAKSTAIYSLGNVSTKLVGFILLPILTNPTYLSIEAYGLLGLFEAVVQLITTVLGLGLYNGLFRWYYEDDSKKGILTFTTTSVLVVIISVGLVGTLLGKNFIAPLLFHDPIFEPAYHWMMVSAGLQTFIVIPVTLMRLNDDAKLFSYSSIIRLLIVLGITIYTLTILENGLAGIYQAQAIAQVVFLVLTSPYLASKMEIGFDVRVFSEIIAYSFPIMIASTLGILINFADRFIINSFSGLEEVGIYSLAMKLSNFIKIFVISTVSLSLTPVLFKKINDSDSRRFYSKTMTYYGFGILIVIMFVSMFSYEVIKVFTGSEEYWEAHIIVPVLSLSLYFVAIKSIGFMGLHISKKMWFLTVLSVGILILNLIFNFLFIPILGSLGAAYASLSCQMMLFFVGYKLSQMQYKIPFELGKIIVMPLLASLLIYISIFTNSIDVWLRILLKSSLILSFPILLSIGGFFEEIEKTRIQQLFIKWRNPKKFVENIKNLLVN